MRGKLRRPIGFVISAWLLASVAICAPAPTSHAATESPRILRVAADPNNLPFSNDRLEGFENKLAELIARELGARLEYMWWPQRRGFFRETLGSGRADLVLGVPTGFERVLTTQPYYRSTYVFISRRGGRRVRSFDDPLLTQVRVGVQLVGDDYYNTPPAHALTARGIVGNVRGYTLYGNYGRDSPPSEIIKAVADGDIEVAVAWGPMAGYFAGKQSVALELTPVAPEWDGPLWPFTYAISMGVRKKDEALKQELDALIERQRDAIARILDDYGVPQLPISPEEREGKEASHVAAR